MSLTLEQRDAAMEKANEVRRVRLDLKRQLREGTITLDDILGGPHPAVVTTPLLDVILWTRCGRLQARSLARLGEEALAARVNLLLPVGKASTRVREWCVDHGERGRHRR
jgi:hypothetical protein